MIKAVIFDCFGVLVGGSLENFIDKFLLHDESLIRTAHEINAQACLGAITYEDQLRQFALLAGVSLEVVHYEMDDNPRNERLLNYITENLKGKYKIGMLSNASDDWLNDLFTDQDLSLFDDIVLSYKVRMAKPDEKIYTLAAERLGVLPEECLFVDDIAGYIQGAERAGMQAIHYTDFASFREQIEKLL